MKRALAHADGHLEIADEFPVHPDVGVWIDVADDVTADTYEYTNGAVVLKLALTPTPREMALAEIARLERLETPRRLAEAVLTDAGRAWLAGNRAAIANIRAGL